MRNPSFWRATALAWAASGPVAGAAAVALPEAPDGLRIALAIYGLTALVFGLASAFWSHRALQAQRSLQSDGNVLARWRVDAATWRKFIARNGELNQAPGALLNELAIRDTVPGHGIEIVVGREAVQIDESIHEVPLRGTPEVTQAALVQDAPDYIELQLLYPGGGHGASGVPRMPTRTALRFPVVPASWRDARAVVAHFNRLTPQQPDFFHGKGDGSDPEDLNTCIACGYRSYKFGSRCPQCGGGMATRRWARRFGGILVACSLAITAIMGTVTYHTAPLMLHPGRSIDGTRFSGTPAQGLMIMGLFALVLAFGLTALTYGIWQMKTGKRDRRVVFGMVCVWMVLLGIAGAL